MNEYSARKTLLVRAYEREGSVHWSDEDRSWATQAAAQVEGENATIDAFIARRSRLAVERLRRRDKATLRLLKAVTWRRGIGIAVFAVAVLAGLLADSIGSGAHINLLAPPLLGLLAWNLLVYLLIVVRGAAGAFSPRARDLGPLARVLAYLGRGLARAEGKLRHGPAQTFLADWAIASRTLTAARIGRALHVAAIGFALGALGGLYLRGVAFEYRVGWESTFLTPENVHALMTIVLGPASYLLDIALPSEYGFEALRFPESTGTNAAPWLHLYAVTIALVVLLPRALLALGVSLVAARLVARFPIRLDDPYYQKLARTLRPGTTAVMIVPYSLQLAPQAVMGVNALMAEALGPKTQVAFAPTVAFSGEDDLDVAGITRNAGIIVPLFALTATPERENHGAFVARLAEAGHRGTVIALVDEGAFRRQFGADSARLAERRDSWRRLLDDVRCPAVFVDLENPDLATAEAQFNSALGEVPQAAAA